MVPGGLVLSGAGLLLTKVRWAGLTESRKVIAVMDKLPVLVIVKPKVTNWPAALWPLAGEINRLLKI
jgi:hypothetical protein